MMIVDSWILQPLCRPVSTSLAWIGALPLPLVLWLEVSHWSGVSDTQILSCFSYSLWSQLHSQYGFCCVQSHHVCAQGTVYIGLSWDLGWCFINCQFQGTETLSGFCNSLPSPSEGTEWQLHWCWLISIFGHCWPLLVFHFGAIIILFVVEPMGLCDCLVSDYSAEWLLSHHFWLCHWMSLHVNLQLRLFPTSLLWWSILVLMGWNQDAVTLGDDCLFESGFSAQLMPRTYCFMHCSFLWVGNSCCWGWMQWSWCVLSHTYWWICWSSCPNPLVWHLWSSTLMLAWSSLWHALVIEWLIDGLVFDCLRMVCHGLGIAASDVVTTPGLQCLPVAWCYVSLGTEPNILSQPDVSGLLFVCSYMVWLFDWIKLCCTFIEAL